MFKYMDIITEKNDNIIGCVLVFFQKINKSIGIYGLLIEIGVSFNET